MATIPTLTSTRAILGPLTTTFTPSPTCSDIYQSPSVILGSFTFFRAATCTSVVVPEPLSSATIPKMVDELFFDQNCYPSQAQAQQTMFGAPYSPGLFCPFGYSTACLAAKLPNGLPSPITEGNSVEFSVSLVPGETAVGCCPSGYDCFVEGDEGLQECISVAYAGHITATQCSSGLPNATVTAEAGSFTSITYLTSGDPEGIGASLWTVTDTAETIEYLSVTAPIIPIYWQASDVPPCGAIALPSTSSRHALSPGAQAAIGTTITVSVIFAASILLSLVFRRRKRARLNVSGSSRDYRKPGLDASTTKRNTLNAGQVAELSPDLSGRELEAPIPPQELAAPTALLELEGH